MMTPAGTGTDGRSGHGDGAVGLEPLGSRIELAATRDAWSRLRSALSAALFEPFAPVVALDERRRLRLLAAMSLVNGVFDALGVVQTRAAAPAAVSDVVAPILLVMALISLLSYALARSAHVVSSAVLLVSTQLAVPLVISFSLPAGMVDARSAGAWLSLAVLMASVTLGRRGVVATGGIAVVGMIATLHDVGAPASSVGEAGFFLCVTTGLFVVLLQHHDGLELDRQAQLRQRNAELEDLRLTLEQRVAERTADLERSTGELLSRSDELARVNDTLRTNQALLLQTEKMAAVGRLTAGFAHELASPLGATLAAVDDLAALSCEYQRSIGDATVTLDDHRAIAKELAEAVALVRLATERSVKFVRGIRTHTRDPGPRAKESFDLAAVAAEAVELLAHAARSANVRVVVEKPPSPVRMVAVPSRMNQIVTNLVKNAIDAIGAESRAGVVTLCVRREAADAVLEVADDGPGIAAEVAPRIFEPLFTTKAYGQGTGLGLSIVREIVQDELLGTVTARSTLGAGATFTVRVPANDGGADGA